MAAVDASLSLRRLDCSDASWLSSLTSWLAIAESIRLDSISMTCRRNQTGTGTGEAASTMYTISPNTAPRVVARRVSTTVYGFCRRPCGRKRVSAAVFFCP